MNSRLFKRWVPAWLIKGILFLLILPNLVLFFLPLANVNAAAGLYGGEPADIQFAVALFYAGYAGFYSLERRFFSFLAAKEYFILFTFLQILVAFGCYQSRELYLLFPLRFIQGMLFACTVNLSLSMMFSRLHSERAREVGFSVFFGALLCALPFNNFITADVIDAFDFNIVYKCAIFAFLPGLLLLLAGMNNNRLHARLPLYKLDWQSFVLHSLLLVLTAYVTLFGQEYYWLDDPRIRYSILGIVFFLGLYILRQKKMKRPYTDLSVFSFRNFNIGILLLFTMYICRFASGITNTFFSSVLKFDPIHVSYINLWNIVGLVTGVIIACCMTLQKIRVRYIWIPGFLLLLGFHLRMFFLFDTQADEAHFFIPLLVQGLGVGLLMVPLIVYAISSVPIFLGPSASSMCLVSRFMGYCISIAVINYVELYEKSRHYNAFQDQLIFTRPVTGQALGRLAHGLAAHGASVDKVAKGADKLLVNSLNVQGQIRFAMDYYEIMSWLIAGLLLLIVLFPRLNRTMVYLRSKRLSPA